MGWPPSAALIVAGGALAFVPDIPSVSLDPNLVLVLFLPPLLADGAWNTELVSFRRHLPGIMSLAAGAVVFSTAAVALVTHRLMPTLSWGACAAQGAIVSPPDAISAKAILARVSLPRKLNALLEGESLLNDATGLVILRFSIAAVVGSAFDPGAAAGRFAILTIGGAAIGVAIGWLWTIVARRLANEVVVIVTTSLVGWAAYLVGEAAGVSGVIAAVTAGLVMGWNSMSSSRRPPGSVPRRSGRC